MVPRNATLNLKIYTQINFPFVRKILKNEHHRSIIKISLKKFHDARKFSWSIQAKELRYSSGSNISYLLFLFQQDALTQPKMYSTR